MYEYKVDSYKLKYAQDAMNAYAKEGWRVIAVSPDRHEGFVDVFFERVHTDEEKTDKAAEELEAAVSMIDVSPDGDGNGDSAASGVTEAEGADEELFAEEDTAGFAAPLAIEALPYTLTICKVKDIRRFDPSNDFFFIGKTDKEVSLVCETDKTPAAAIVRDDGWKALRVQGTLDFSLIGILSGITSVLADNGIGILSVSTYDTDYILVKKERFEQALKALSERGYEICR